MTLDELGLKYGTDKASHAHGYLGTYEQYFTPWRERSFVLIEIGVAEGRSLAMWREFFPNATVVGIDEVNNNHCCEGARIFIGDQSDEAFLERVVSEIGAPSIVIDDGGHKGRETIRSFRCLFPRMTAGLYAVEDTHCFYCDHYAENSGVFDYFSGKARDIDVAGIGMTGRVQTALNWPGVELPEFSRELAAMHIHPSLWIFERR